MTENLFHSFLAVSQPMWTVVVQAPHDTTLISVARDHALFPQHETPSSAYGQMYTYLPHIQALLYYKSKC